MPFLAGMSTARARLISKFEGLWVGTEGCADFLCIRTMLGDPRWRQSARSPVCVTAVHQGKWFHCERTQLRGCGWLRGGVALGPKGLDVLRGISRAMPSAAKNVAGKVNFSIGGCLGPIAYKSRRRSKEPREVRAMSSLASCFDLLCVEGL